MTIEELRALVNAYEAIGYEVQYNELASALVESADQLLRMAEAHEALQARCDKLEAAALNVLAHLSAAVSVIETSEENGNHPSCAYGSDTMYQMAMEDFHKSMEAGREALTNRSKNHDPAL